MRFFKNHVCLSHSSISRQLSPQPHLSTHPTTMGDLNNILFSNNPQSSPSRQPPKVEQNNNNNNNDWFASDPTHHTNPQMSSSGVLSNNMNGASYGGGNMGGNMGSPIVGQMGSNPTPHNNNNSNNNNNHNDNNNNNNMNANCLPEDDYENEPPLLEELGINLPHIREKTLAVLNPMKPVDADLMSDTDMAGPLAFCLLLGMSLLLRGKVHFGYIYGFGVFGCLAVATVIQLMAPSSKDIRTWLVFSILGYNLLPINFLALVAVLIDLKGFFGLILSVVAISWSTAASTRLFETCCG